MAQAGAYLPNPYSPLTVGNNDPSWGMNGLLYQFGQQRQYNDCMKALGWHICADDGCTKIEE
jgi:hypothetical protein